jgi:hypothetical protein
MEKVIRVCEITGRVTVVAECVTTERAMEIVKEKAKADEFGMYKRVAYDRREELKKAYFAKPIKA